MRVLFWAEGGAAIGSGHLVRSTTLAREMKSRQEVAFLAVSAESRAFLSKRGFQPLSPETLPQEGCLLVTDLRHPEEHLPLLEVVKARAFHHLSLQDLGLAKTSCDTVVDGHLKALYPYDEGERPVKLLGPEYFLLSPRYIHFHDAPRKVPRRVRRIFLSLGGWCDTSTLRLFVEPLLREGFTLTLAWGFGKSSRERRLFRKSFPSVRLVAGSLPDTARRYYEADIALVCGGISFYEAACCGTPSLLLAKDSLQGFAAESLVKEGFGLSGGLLEEITPDSLLEKLSPYLSGRVLRTEHLRRGRELVDGKGLFRVRHYLEGLPPL